MLQIRIQGGKLQGMTLRYLFVYCLRFVKRWGDIHLCPGVGYPLPSAARFRVSPPKIIQREFDRPPIKSEGSDGVSYNPVFLWDSFSNTIFHGTVNGSDWGKRGLEINCRPDLLCAYRM